MLLVRYGVIPEFSRCAVNDELNPHRGQSVVVETHRGLMVGQVLEVDATPDSESPAAVRALRIATNEDLAEAGRLRGLADEAFPKWQQRITDWQLDLQLVDLEWMLDETKLVVYVLSERGPDCTKLALQAAAAGLGTIEVQPVSADGLVTLATSTGGCGTCGCG